MHLHLTFSGWVCILSLQGRQEHCPFTTRLRVLKLRSFCHANSRSRPPAGRSHPLQMDCSHGGYLRTIHAEMDIIDGGSAVTFSCGFPLTLNTYTFMPKNSHASRFFS